MDPTIAATVIGVLLTVAFATAFTWLRSATNARFDKMDWTPASTGSKPRSSTGSKPRSTASS